MSEPIPGNSVEALAAGWHMVCIVPSLSQTNLRYYVEKLTKHCECCQDSVRFTYKGTVLQSPQAPALWVKNFDWAKGYKSVIEAFYLEPQLARFAREIAKRHMPDLVLAKSRNKEDLLLEIEMGLRYMR